jgi:hypothetical protein
LSLWFKLDAPPARGRTHIIASESIELILDIRDEEQIILWHVIGSMNGARPDGKKNLYWLGASMTHLNVGQWYHVALVWDIHDSEKCGVFVDSVRQVAGAPYRYDGQIRPGVEDLPMTIGAAGVTVSALRAYEEALDEEQLTRIRKKSWNDYEGYSTEGRLRKPPLLDLSEVDWEHPVYATAFDTPEELANWELEGGYEARIEKGRLVLQNAAPEGQTSNLVCWLKPVMPADYLLEFTFRPKDHRTGLAIVFLNARGVNGESIFDSSLQTRDGTFRQYTSGDIDNYHISYWSGGRGSANVRKNVGFDLVAIGDELVYNAPQDKMQMIQIYKKGGALRLLVDGKVAVAYDDERRHGPVHNHTGWIGLRQMGHTEWAEYGRLRVYPLK